MAKFSAGHVEPLDYDFTPVQKADGGGYCTGKGTIPEPSRRDIEEYFEGIKAVETKAMDSGMVRATEDDWAGFIDVVAALCKGNPSGEQLEELPFRVLVGFMQWLNREFANPEVSRAGMRR